MGVIPTIRTSPHTTRRDPPPSTTRTIAKILRELVRGRRFDDFADLKAELRVRLARLRIRYQPHEFDDAISLLVAGGAPLLVETRPPKRIEPIPEGELISRALASEILSRLGGKARTW